MLKTARTISLDGSWSFCNGEAKRWENREQAVCYTTAKTGFEVGDMEVFLQGNPWKTVRIPHDWNTEQPSSAENAAPLGSKPRDKGWYWRSFTLPELPEDACVLLEFEGVQGECVVYVNGAIVARNFSGYTGFTADISDYILPNAENTVIVSVDNTRWEGWWYEGAGIYRSVSLCLKPAVHLQPNATFVHPKREETAWSVPVEYSVENTGDTPREFVLHSRILDGETTVAELETKGTVSAYETMNCHAETKLENPRLWNPQEPNLYTLETTLTVDGETVEQERVCFGFREIVWTTQGMYLNGELTKVKGICCHQDHAGVGVAVTKSLLRYRIARLKSLGINAYRCAHNCPSKYLLEVCDELGMLVMTENRHFRETPEVEEQLRWLVCTARNHPSVFLYSMFNEERWQSEKRGRKIFNKMRRFVRSLDDTRPVTGAVSAGVLEEDTSTAVMDVAGINYCLDDLAEYAARHPEQPMVGTENCPLFATRDTYVNDREKHRMDSYGNQCAAWTKGLEDTLDAVNAVPQMAGLFVWGGFDYRGEPSPFAWPSIFSHWALTDCCGFAKDTAYFLKTYYDDTPMVHLLPHWNWKTGETVRVCAMTNCERVQLFVNGKAWEEKAVQRNRAEWQVPFEQGSIAVKAWKGETLVTDEIHTAGESAKFILEDAAPEKDFDSSVLNVCLTDENGNPTRFVSADRKVRFEVLCGTMQGTGNGDPTGIRDDLADTLPTFCGRCQAVILPDETGKVQVKVHVEGMETQEYCR